MKLLIMNTFTKRTIEINIIQKSIVSDKMKGDIQNSRISEKKSPRSKKQYNT